MNMVKTRNTSAQTEGMSDPRSRERCYLAMSSVCKVEIFNACESIKIVKKKKKEKKPPSR